MNTLKLALNTLNLRILPKSAAGKLNSFIAVVAKLNHILFVIFELNLEILLTIIEASDKTVVDVSIGDFTSHDNEPTMTGS